MYNPAEYLFSRMVQKANDREFWRRLTDFVAFHEFNIQQVGIVLEFLGLAEQTDNGWAANCRLMTIIAEQLARRSQQNGKIKVTQDDRDGVRLIYRLAVGIDVHWCDDGAEDIEAANWCCNVLAALGFVKKRLNRLIKEKLQEMDAADDRHIGRSSKELSAQSPNIVYLTTPLTPRATVPVAPFHSKRAGGRPFGSAAGEQAGEQRGRLAIPAFRGHSVKVQPTKLSAKLPVVRSRKVQDKKAKRPSRDDLSDW
jgi:hypothetical protein